MAGLPEETGLWLEQVRGEAAERGAMERGASPGLSFSILQFKGAWRTAAWFGVRGRTLGLTLPLPSGVTSFPCASVAHV